MEVTLTYFQYDAAMQSWSESAAFPSSVILTHVASQDVHEMLKHGLRGDETTTGDDVYRLVCSFFRNDLVHALFDGRPPLLLVFEVVKLPELEAKMDPGSKKLRLCLALYLFYRDLLFYRHMSAS